MPRERGESSGSRRVISRLETTACTAPESAKPRISAQRISQVMPKAKLRASARDSANRIPLGLLEALHVKHEHDGAADTDLHRVGWEHTFAEEGHRLDWDVLGAGAAFGPAQGEH